MAALRAFKALSTLIVGYACVYRLFFQIGWPEYKHLLLRAVRLLKFGVVGLTVLVIGAVLLQYLYVGLHLPYWQAYVIEAVVSVQLNFLGSWFYTWRERRSETTFLRALGQFNIARFASVGLNSAVFVHLWVEVYGLPLQVANLLNVVIASAWNYSAGENIIFAEGRRVRPDFVVPPKKDCPRVAIVVPCKNNQDTIATTLRHFGEQLYAASVPENWVTAILVGDPNDPTWDPVAFRAIPPSPIKFVEVGVQISRRHHKRDANAKRTVGAQMATNMDNADIVVFADADIMPDRSWLWRAVSLMTVDGYDMVAGPLVGQGDSFWRTFIDRTTGVSGSKTPRVPREILLTRDNVGEHKPPVTANLFVSRRVIDAIGEPPPNFGQSYEDYAYVQRALDAGFNCLIHPLLAVRRQHREGWRKLSGEYLRSGKGCGDFLAVFRKHQFRKSWSRFAVWRVVVLAALPAVLAVTAVAGVVLPVMTLAAVNAVVISLMLTNLLATLPLRKPLPSVIGRWLPKRVREWRLLPKFDGLLYPYIGIYFSLRFVYGVCERFRRLGLEAPPMPRVGPAKIVRFGPNGQRL